MKKLYPNYVCSVCGKKYGKTSNRVSTYHAGQCDVCGGKQYITESRDFEPLNLPEEFERKLETPSVIKDLINLFK